MSRGLLQGRREIAGLIGQPSDEKGIHRHLSLLETCLERGGQEHAPLTVETLARCRLEGHGPPRTKGLQRPAHVVLDFARTQIA